MQTFDTPGDVTLPMIRLPSGRVRVSTADDPHTSVELVSKRGSGVEAHEDVVVRAEERQGRHVITIEQRDKIRWGPIQINWGGDLEVRITCPPGSDLDMAGGSTDLDVQGELGAVSAKSASGDLKLDDVRARLEAKTASGDISVGALPEGRHDRLGVRRSRRRPRSRPVERPHRVRGRGDRRHCSRRAATADGLGDARIGVARGTRVWIDATSVSGDLGSELGLADSAPAGDDSGEEGGEVVPLQVKTVSGDVKIVRAAEALVG